MEKHYKVIADKETLEKIGICYYLTGKIGKLTHTFSNDWYELEIEHTIGGSLSFTNKFDIPKGFLEEVL